ncbi:MAG: 3-methyl-2-oxobutanoate hydroxymethyltransferase [Rhodospirillales bacterium]|nr:3-methyl-2-oxobutanoate hydroxymethyltransferase [Rhodospirillales bacterium]
MTIPDLAARKGGPPIVVLTAYTAPMARLLDPHVDALLVGDSVGMVLHGMDDTLGVTLDMMVLHTAAVKRGSTRAAIIADLPFGTYQASPTQAFDASARLLGVGAQSVKLEGGRAMAETVAFLVERGVPVMGHIGLTPQSLHAMGGFRVQGRDEEAAERIVDDARAIADAGAFSVVIEGVMEPLARRITETIRIPTIGIGASADCDGQVLVTDDILGLTGDATPRFVQRYAELATTIDEAARTFAEDVRARRFPGKAHIFLPKAAQ